MNITTIGSDNVHKIERTVDPLQRELNDALEEALKPFYGKATLIEMLGALEVVKLELHEEQSR